MKQALIIVLASALVTTAAIKAAPALAEAPAADLNISLVRTADLDLNSDSGRRQLDRRLANAAREVCGTASDTDLKGKNAVRECRDETVARAKSQREAMAESRDGVIAVTAAR